VLDVGPDGDRIPRVLEDWERWIGSFDVVQLNDDELASLLPDARDPLAEVGRVLDGRPSAVFVTRGREGVDYVACANVTMLPGSRATPGACSRITGRVGIESHAEAVDPTGCGDVWGAVCFGSLLDQVPLEEAMRAANRAATSAAQHRGATGLAGRLKLETDGGDTDWSGENEAMKR
jgi:sugar/nucleoside kinase (ribokinase family)